MAVVSLTSKRMRTTSFQACHIRTPRLGEAVVTAWSVVISTPNRKATR